ncbi:hypothetical protein N1028_13345 [Herbiconiux sp. CPCC 203407]|uniref:Alkaline shock response membrane anchor protein AmaP n=1 Tax=Herbiconiux oxytropis TaxID=2970915 RepID=A0AA41XET1_9MICO|nr:hypothetical protein [Herbiconiux oxytropis]MCS5723052.1 hypothetical protein [Herbiconiux oxytropis]MCS5726879.1 hypothetical protein [Herbiconiux oxytropis]
MNSTNRVANRLLVLIVGLLLVVVAAAAAAAVLIPTVRDAWKAIAGDVNAQVASWLQATPLGDTGVSWIMPAVLVVIVLAVILLVVFIVRQGRGHTRTVLSERTSEHGRTEVESALAANALEDAIGSRPEFIASHVSAYRVRRTPVLKIAVTCRRGVSPKDAADIVDDAVRALDELLGRPLPALVQISGGFRSRTGSSTRLQ